MIRRSSYKEKITHNSIEWNGIRFDSQLEYDVYFKLQWLGIDFEYQPKSFEYSSAVYPTIEYIHRHKKYKRKYKRITQVSKHLDKDMRMIDACEYTPDFKLNLDNKVVFLEMKGFATDIFKLRFNLWRKFMDQICSGMDNIVIAQCHSVKEVEELINYLNYETI